MEHLVAPFCYLRNKAAFRHVCVGADKARQEKLVYVPPLGSEDPTGNRPDWFFHRTWRVEMDPARVTSPL